MSNVSPETTARIQNVTDRAKEMGAELLTLMREHQEADPNFRLDNVNIKLTEKQEQKNDRH